MSFRALLAAFGFSLCSAFGAAAQVEAEDMSDLSIWGTRLQSSDDVDFPNTLWSGSDNGMLLPLLRGTRVHSLTPAEMKLMRRLILSPARPPEGEGTYALLAERTRLLEEIGEAEAASAIASQGAAAGLTLSRRAAQIDLELAAGNEATACGALSTAEADEPYWVKLRAVCAVLEGNYSGAELAIEFASAQGVFDFWLVEAIFSASGDAAVPALANFESGLNIALSAAGEFDLSEIDPRSVRPDLAAAAIMRPNLPIELRADLAEYASERGHLAAADWRRFLQARLETEGYAPQTAQEEALSVFADPGASIGEKAEKLAETLSLASQDGIRTYAATARLFQEELETLPPVEPVTPYALLYARAALMIGHQPLAHHWLESVELETVAAPAPFDLAELQALDLIFGGAAEPAQLKTLETRLLETWDGPGQERKARRLISALIGLEYKLSPQARAFVTSGDDPGRSIDPARLFDIKAAITSGALAEASLRLLGELEGTPDTLAALDLAAVLELLSDMGASDIAGHLALEANQIWKP